VRTIPFMLILSDILEVSSVASAERSAATYYFWSVFDLKIESKIKLKN